MIYKVACKLVYEIIPSDMFIVLTMDRWKGKIAVVTGASAGIGLEITKTLLREGMIVVGIARRRDKMLEELSNCKGFENFFARKCDITILNEVTEVFDYIKSTFKTVHVLVNNAGLAKIKKFDDAEIDELQEVINVNLMGVVYCTKYAIRLMKDNDHDAQIININSIAGQKIISPDWFRNDDIHFNLYSSSKYAVRALSETLNIELRGSKIRVTNLSPGYVMTDIITEEQKKETSLINKSGLTTNDIANAVLYIIGAPQHVQITQLTMQPLSGSF